MNGITRHQNTGKKGRVKGNFFAVRITPAIFGKGRVNALQIGKGSGPGRWAPVRTGSKTS